MRRTFFIILLAIFFAFDIFFAISTAVAENIKSSSNIEINHSQVSQTIQDIDRANLNTFGVLTHHK